MARSIHEYSLKYKNKEIKYKPLETAQKERSKNSDESTQPSEIDATFEKYDTEKMGGIGGLKLQSINCGAIPTELLESELFGTVPGGFTHSSKIPKIGLWELANNGSLFLDEIGDLAPHHQVKILRALSSGKIRRVGATEERPVNARIIAATNKNLQEMVKIGEKEGGFREDLYYRLKGITIRTVPLDSTNSESLKEIMQSSWSKIVNPDAPKKPKKKSESTTDAKQESANSDNDKAKSTCSTATAAWANSAIGSLQNWNRPSSTCRNCKNTSPPSTRKHGANWPRSAASMSVISKAAPVFLLVGKPCWTDYRRLSEARKPSLVSSPARPAAASRQCWRISSMPCANSIRKRSSSPILSAPAHAPPACARCCGISTPS